ncbi:MAG: peptide/nickel transport system substrate-binding protein [Gaiellales bacterium]|jgi:peptide/nickel transport system substrate-binding protein|nr:peptide/nickel transport system substrate-binding protein [Gaiellales bacterium]
MDDIRRKSSELENHLIDEMIAGRITRREFVRRGTVMGMSIPLISLIVAACGGANGSGGSSGSTGGGGGTPKKGGTIKVAIVVPTGAINPVTVGDQGGLCMLGQVGEFLTIADPTTLKLSGHLADSWTPNADASEWTFKLKSGVTFQDGTPMTSKDVVYTMDLLSDSKGGSNALSVFGGVLDKGGSTAVDDATVKFTLLAPNGNFPYLVSRDNYNAIIIKDGSNPKDFEKDNFPGTGPMKLEKYTTQVGASFVRNESYWDAANKAYPARVEFTFYADEPPQIQALQGGTVDCVGQISVSGGRALLSDPSYNIIDVPSTAHRQVHMRNDKAPFTDKRVRQAMALCMDRPGIIEALFAGKAALGNDSPFAAVYPSTDTSVPQRAKDLTKAKQLLSDAGMPNGFSVTLNTEKAYEIPDYALQIQADAKEAGITVNILQQSPTVYYGDFTFGNSPWLDSTMGITDYAHRSVPNVLLGAPLLSTGTWNSAHFKNPTYDGLVKQYFGAIDLQTQKTVAGQIETLLLDETPIMFVYFYDFLAATKKTLAGVLITPVGHVQLEKAGFTT